MSEHAFQVLFVHNHFLSINKMLKSRIFINSCVCLLFCWKPCFGYTDTLSVGTSCLSSTVTCSEGIFPHETGLLCGNSRCGNDRCHYWQAPCKSFASFVSLNPRSTHFTDGNEWGLFTSPKSHSWYDSALRPSFRASLHEPVLWTSVGGTGSFELFLPSIISCRWTRPVRKYLPSENEEGPLLTYREISCSLCALGSKCLWKWPSFVEMCAVIHTSFLLCTWNVHNYYAEMFCLWRVKCLGFSDTHLQSNCCSEVRCRTVCYVSLILSYFFSLSFI